jgi:hypothetical protein
MESAQQAVHVEGSGNQVITVGNDLVLNYVQQKTEFFRPSLDPYKSPPFVSPLRIGEIAYILYEKRILILGGSPEVDKDGLARHVAWYLSNRIEREKKDGLDCVEVMEWRHISDYQSLRIGLQEAQTPSIFILPQVSLADVGHDLLRLKLDAGKNHHFLVISTEKPASAWNASEGGPASGYWFELSPESLYNPAKLTNALIQDLLDAQEREALPESLSHVKLTPDTPLAGRITIQQVASQLRTPKNVDFFVELLCQEKQPLTEAMLETWLKTSRDSSRVFKQWFLSALKSHEQTAALGLALFEGMFDDQFFTALETVTREAWRGRDPQIHFPDYEDLENLTGFYELVNAEDGSSTIHSKNPGQRQLLFDLLWKGHRRRLLASLPVVVRLASNSVKSREVNLSLYGSYIRRSTLRETIAESLSHLGWISREAVEESLLQLAADRDFAVQAIPAKAMARWRESGLDSALFEMLHRWQTEARCTQIVRGVLEERNEKSDHRPEAYIRATIAITTGRAALYDPPNQLSGELVSLFRDLARDPDELVRDRFRGYTLPLIVSQHLNQVSKDLRDIIRHLDLIRAVGSSLARAYRVIPEDVINLLNAWYRECEKNRPAQASGKAVTHRDAILATIAMAYGHIDYSKGSRLLKADDALKRLLSMLETERQPLVRNAIVLALALQARDHFEAVEAQLRRLLPEVTPNERGEIVKILSDVYLQQRANLEGGDDLMRLDERTYPVWEEAAKRPLTQVEQALYGWLEMEGNTAARQVATEAFVKFALAFDQPERAFFWKKKEAGRRKQSSQPGAVLSPGYLPNAIRQLSFVQRLAAYFATLKAAKLRPLINDLLPEAVLQFRDHPVATEFVIENWKSAPPDTLQKAARHLRTAIWLARNALVLGVVALGLLLCGSFWLSVINLFSNGFGR